MHPPWLARVRRPMARLRGAGLVVAVSGGGDSVGLLRVLHDLAPDLDLRVSVAHLDHGTRGEEGQADARFVADLAASLGLEFDLGHWRPTRENHFEADARQARYSWLAGVARARKSAFVAVGQTLDDQAETILHRVVRGTGLRGLAGIPGRRPLATGVVLVRPLLRVSRREIRDYLSAIGQPFREDSTNLDTSRTRALIRLELLPAMANLINPDVDQALVRLARMASGASRVLERLTLEQLAATLLESRADRLVLDRRKLAGLSRFERAELLRVAWRRAGWPEQAMDARRWRRLAKLGDTRLSIVAGFEATSTGDHLILSRLAPACEPVTRLDPVPLPVPGWSSWLGGRVETLLDPAGSRDESIDLEALALPLTIRQAEPGDRFGPLGLGGKTQPLNDFFRGRRVPRSGRGLVPIVCDQTGIIWVVGHRISQRVALTEATRQTLGLRFEAGSP